MSAVSRKDQMRERFLAQRGRELGVGSTESQANLQDDGDESRASGVTSLAAAPENENEVKQSEKLINALKTKRQRILSELEADRSKEDADAMMKLAKQRTRQRLLDESGGEDGDTGKRRRRESEIEKEEGSDAEEEGLRSPPMTERSMSKTRGPVTPRMATQALTLREKLAEKMRAAMDKGKEEAYSEKREAKDKLMGSRRAGEGKMTRFDDSTLVREDDDETSEDELEKSVNVRVADKWKDVTKLRKSADLDMPTEEEAFDFFTKVWELEESNKEEEKEETRATEGEREREGEAQAEQEEEAEDTHKGPEDKKPLLEDADDDENSWMLYQYGRAQYVTHSERMQKEKEIFYVPSMAEAPPEQKTFLAGHPRNLEEEGFYVGERPFVPNRNLYKMENRLLKEAGRTFDEEGNIDNTRSVDRIRKWFGEDGRLITLPDPVKQISSRPPILEDEGLTLVTPYIEPSTYQMKAKYVEGHYQLDIDVNTIVFTHHHLFSREHVKASQLLRLNEEYLLRCKKKAVEFLSGKMQALKSAKRHIEQNIESMKNDPAKEKTLLEQQHMLKIYKDDIRIIRRQKDFEMESERTLMKSMLKTWKEIKALRNTEQCTNTAVKLQIRKEPANKAEDEEDWRLDIEEELEEIQEELIESYQKSVKEYKKHLEEWKQQKLKKKEANKRQKSKRRGNTVTEEEARMDMEILAEADLPKPVKPKPTTDSDAKERIEAKYRQIRRIPGEPKLYFELTNSATITNTQDCPRAEQHRRSEVNKYRVFVKVVFNDKDVYRTSVQPLGQDFIVRFAQIFNVEIMYWPESIELEIHETAGLGSERLCSVYAAVPETNVTQENSHLVEISFSSDLKKSPSNHLSSVGSGVPFSIDSSGTSIQTLLTSGFLTASVVWAVDDEGNILVPPTRDSRTSMYSAMKGMDPITAIGMSGIGDVSKMSKWIEESHLDPNDPNNADVMHLIKPMVRGSEMNDGVNSMKDHFRLEHIQDEFNFVTDEDFENSKRFRLISLRDEGVEGFRHVTVPAYDREVNDALFDEYEKRLRAEEKYKDTDDADTHHVAVAKFMQKVRLQVMQNCLKLQQSYQYSDLVHEDAVPNIGFILPQLVKLARPRRNLKPIRNERKKINAQNLQSMEVKILINVMRAFGIPVRTAPDTAAQAAAALRLAARGRLSPIGEDLNTTNPLTQALNKPSETSTVRPYIEVMFQRHVASTSVAEGPNASWNEEICIPFRPPDDDYSPGRLRTVNDILYLNLFDEFMVDVSQLNKYKNLSTDSLNIYEAGVKDDRQRSTTVHQRIERRWLGSLKIPFSTIYTNGRIDGTFRLVKPPVLLGYTYENRHRGGDIGADLALGDAEHTYISMFITIEPQLATPELLANKFDSMETEEMLKTSDLYQSELQKKFPKREYTTMVINLEGVSIFVTRYIRPLNPPEQFIKGDLTSPATAEMIARYVSFIPSVSDSVVFPGFCDIWSSCSQFLQMLQGDEEEHAVLLTNYFLHIGKQAWLLIGSGIPEGASAYVLTHETHDRPTYWIWNAVTGEHFDYRDNYCPVHSVGCLVNASNVWANIQPRDKPSQISFNLENASQWKPFFTKDFPNPGLGSVQLEKLTYREPDESEAKALQEKIESELKKKMAEWRPRHITKWNRYCVQAFRRLLIQLEKSCGKGQPQDHHTELDTVVASYRLCGFPINLAYTEMKPLVDAVYATGVHEFESDEVEFALAAHVEPYPNSVLSVWIYVASLIRKRL